MKIKRLLSYAFMGVILMTFVSSPWTFAATIDPGVFDDVSPTHPNFQAIEYLRDNGVVVGYGDGTYRESQNINRAEFLKIVMEVSDYDLGGADCYPDVKDEWFAEYVCAATSYGFVEGYPDGNFYPGKDINFVEASKIIDNVLEVGDINATGGQWFEGFVRILDDVDAIPADIDRFDHTLTRADMAEMIWRIDTDTTYKISNSYENIQAGVTVPELGGELQEFDSCPELAKYLENNVSSYAYYGDFGVMEDMFVPSLAPREEAAADSSKESAGAPGGAGEAATEFSSTSVQVEGVDEADIVKNDGKYIYMLKGDTVRVIEAYPPSSMKELDIVNFGNPDFYPSEMYVDGNRLVVIGWSYEDTFDNYNYYGAVTKVYIFDLTDKTNVRELRELSFEGDYTSSRKVGDTVYVVANQYNYYPPIPVPYTEDEIIPLYMDSSVGNAVEPLVGCGDVRFVPGVIDTTDYLMVAAIPITTASSTVKKEVVVGSATTDIYASKDNLYVAQAKYSWWWSESNEEKTFIHKFALDGTNLTYEGVGEVPGTILNQFSMDENGQYFRIATTNGGWWTDKGPVNNVYVMDSNLKVVGSLEGLAPGEEIYSTRFIGNRLYMVTFEQIDPLFVIDLTNPIQPKVLGELHIPGVSDYLHPFDENHIIGFGLDTASEDVIAETGWSWFQGLKISMFDVTDVNNPKELHKTTIGDRGSSSELLYNHKALLFDAEKGIMAFPLVIAEIPEPVKADSDLDISRWVYGDYVFQGAYVYDVSIEDGFSLRGAISHYDDNELGSDFEYYYWYGVAKNIERILYIGDYFYTTSDSMVKANKMDTLNEVAGLTLAE